MSELKNKQTEAGATFSETVTVPVSFGSDKSVVQAAQEKVALCDRSHQGLLQISDVDRLSFLHNQSTNQIKNLQPGQGCETIFVTSTARTIDLVTVYVTEDTLLVSTSPGQNQSLMSWLDRYLFPMDRVKLEDISDKYAVFSLIGPQSDSLLQNMGLETLQGQPDATHQLLTLAGVEVRLAVGSGLALPGYTLIVPVSEAATVWEQLTTAGATPMGDRVWEKLRIFQGRPLPGRELTEEYNALEAGLWRAISFDKGCYIGQETIARLNTYKGVKQRLWGVKLAGETQSGVTITVAEKKVGTLTSYTETPSGFFGLAYIKTKAGGVGLQVKVGETTGELVATPFLSHEYFVS